MRLSDHQIDAFFRGTIPGFDTKRFLPDPKTLKTPDFPFGEAAIFLENILKTPYANSSIPNKEIASQPVNDAISVQAIEKISTATFI